MITSMTIKYTGRFHSHGGPGDGTYLADWGTYRVTSFDAVLAEAERVAGMGGVAKVWIEVNVQPEPEPPAGDDEIALAGEYES